MNTVVNLDLLSVGIAVAATVVMGFTVYVTNTKSVTNRVFFLFSLVTAVWGMVNYFSYSVVNPVIALWLFRGVLFSAVLQAFFLYDLFVVFPDDTYTFGKRHRYILIPLVILTLAIVLSPLAFQGIVGTIKAGKVAELSTGPGMLAFALVAISLVIGAVYKLIQKLRTTSGRLHTAVVTLLAGVVVMFALIIFFNLIVSVVFKDPQIVPFGAFFTFPFIIAATYAILHEHLFNIKIIGTTILVFLLSIASFVEIIFSDSLPLMLLRAGVFLLVLVFGVSLIRGVLREVEQRERIELLAKDLEVANAQQVALIHFISHQLKGFIGKAKGIFSVLREGDYGPLSETMQPLIEEGFNSASQGAQTIQEILNASNIKSGKMTYTMAPFDFKELVDCIIDALKPNADAKNVALTLEEPEDPVMLTGDRMQLENALKNLVDNAIKYTPEGSITATLTDDRKIIRFKTVDTGVGITPEDMQRLFTEGGHGAESQKVNVDSTGFGLYIVKNIIEAHGGKVWAESEGKGKGSTFIVELPVSAQDTGK